MSSDQSSSGIPLVVRVLFDHPQPSIKPLKRLTELARCFAMRREPVFVTSIRIVSWTNIQGGAFNDDAAIKQNPDGIDISICSLLVVGACGSPRSRPSSRRRQ
jgi:hypothetical protein